MNAPEASPFPKREGAAPRGRSSTEHRRLLGIQAARGVAALMVVAFHATLVLAQPRYLGYIPLGDLFGFGHAGVDFFFVLSGFIITYVHGPDIGQPHRLGRYAWRRVTRIYPIYWIVTAVVGARDLFMADAAARLRPRVLFESLTLIPMGGNRLVPVAWTLEHEMLFYCAFGLAILNRALAKFLAAGCVLLVFAGVYERSVPWLFGFLASAFHIQFLMGIAAALVIARWNLRYPLLIASAGAALFATTAALDVQKWIEGGHPAFILMYGLGSAMVILGIATMERAGTIRCGRLAETFGGASYTLYLTHLFIVILAAKLCARMGLLGETPDWIIVTIQVGASVIAALGIHLLIEKPIMRLVRQMERTSLGRAAVVPRPVL